MMNERMEFPKSETRQLPLLKSDEVIFKRWTPLIICFESYLNVLIHTLQPKVF